MQNACQIQPKEDFTSGQKDSPASRPAQRVQRLRYTEPGAPAAALRRLLWAQKQAKAIKFPAWSDLRVRFRRLPIKVQVYSITPCVMVSFRSVRVVCFAC